MNKIVLTKKTSAIFLAIVLVAGTIALSSSSFIIASAQATSDRERDHDDDEKLYGKDRDRDDKSRDHDKDYDDEDDKKSYGKDRDRDRDRDDKSRDHTDDNNEYDYESTKYSDYIDKRYNNHDSEYGMDNDYKDRYGKDSYESQYSSYGKDNSYKSKDSSNNSVSIKKIKCNNINANLNGIGVNIGATNDNGPVTGPIAEAQALVYDDNEGTESFVNNGESRQSDSNSNSRIVCINNNENVVVGEEPIPESDLACEECFAANSTLQTAIIDALSSGIGFTTTTFTEDSEGQLISEAIVSGGQIDTLEKFCNEIENAAEFLGVPLSDEIVRSHLLFIIEIGTGSPADFQDSIDELIECLLEKGLIVDREELEPDSLSANGIAGANSQCIGDPLCARLQ